MLSLCNKIMTSINSSQYSLELCVLFLEIFKLLQKKRLTSLIVLLYCFEVIYYFLPSHLLIIIFNVFLEYSDQLGFEASYQIDITLNSRLNVICILQDTSTLFKSNLLLVNQRLL